uniref:C-type lectin domain-containing protein n=1 Tax=Acrobeloides nanus TaxID=290746 RepID=A0A914EFS1_9BILA
MHNYLGSSNSLSKDIEWSILQANCYCGDVILYTPIFYYDNANKRYTKYAECIGFVNVLGYYPNSTLDLCSYYPNSTLDLCSYDPNLPIIPSFVLTSEKQNFINKYVPRGNNPFTAFWVHRLGTRIPG